MKGYGPVNTKTSFCHDDCCNFVQNPTASIKSYWEPGYRDGPVSISPHAEATTGHVQGRLGFGVFSTSYHCHYYKQTGRPRCTTHKCNSCTLTTLAKQCKHTDILKEIGRYSKLRPRAREDDGWMGVWIFSLFLLSIF